MGGVLTSSRNGMRRGSCRNTGGSLHLHRRCRTGCSLSQCVWVERGAGLRETVPSFPSVSRSWRSGAEPPAHRFSAQQSLRWSSLAYYTHAQELRVRKIRVMHEFVTVRVRASFLGKGT